MAFEMSKTLQRELRQQRLKIINRLRGADDNKRPIPGEIIIEIFSYLAANFPAPGGRKPPTMADFWEVSREVMPVDDLDLHFGKHDSANERRFVGLIRAAIWRRHRFLSLCSSFEDGLVAGQILNRFEPLVASQIQDLHLYYLLYHPSQLLDQWMDQEDLSAEIAEEGMLLESFPRDEEEAEEVARAMPRLRIVKLSLLSFAQLDRSGKHSFPHRHWLPETLEMMVASGVLQTMIKCIRIMLLKGKTGARKRAFLEINPEHDIQTTWLRIDITEDAAEVVCGRILEAATDVAHTMERQDHESEQEKRFMSD